MVELFVTERVRVRDLVPNEKNPRKITAEAKRKLMERLGEFGMIGIPVRDADGSLLSGHQRCAVLMQAGEGDTLLDVRTATQKLTEEQRKRVMLIENGHAGEYDLAVLQSDFGNIDLDDFGIDFSALEKQVSGAQDSDAPNEPELPIVAKMSEKYTSFVVVCTNEIDENHVAEKLGIERGKCYKSSKIGSMHVVRAEKLIASWN